MEISHEPKLGLKKKAALLEGPFFYPLQCIWQKTGKEVYSCRHGELAFERVGSIRVVAGDPRAKSLKDQIKVYHSFVKLAESENARVCGYYFSEEFAKNSGQVIHRCGVSRALLIKGWSLDGAIGEEARRALKKVHECGLEVARLEDPHSRPVKQLISKWKRSKGWVKIKFLLSEPEQALSGLLGGSEVVFVCRGSMDGCAHALVSLRRYMGSSHWYIDSLVQDSSGHKFAIDACIAEALCWLKSQKGSEVVSFGFCPGIIEHPSTYAERILSYWRKTKLLYSPEGLYNFKRKYTDVELPRYMLLSPKGPQWRQLFAMEVVTLFLRRN